ncbi:DUF2141 domain-containing protein [Blastomonas sp.]|uniref:DUF2141 domain-containing protein n=1 Tax=Blastomonas sp. TaxID=1909299 RepID=UPI0035934E25
MFKISLTSPTGLASLAALAAGGLVLAASIPAAYAQRQTISNDMSKCAAGASGPAVHVSVSGFKAATGRVRVQAYPATKQHWLEKGAWINRIDSAVSPRGGKMEFCVPLADAGSYGIAVRHDIDGSGKSGWNDGGGFSNNPTLSLLSLKPPASKTAIRVGNGVTRISVVLNYRQGTVIRPIG